jgi:hypothetical protein
MLADGLRVTHVSQSGYPFGCDNDAGAQTWEISCGALPDLTDPATLGCLLALVRKAWGDPTLCAIYVDGDDPVPWSVSINLSTDSAGTTEAEALVAALEAAP